MLDTIRKTFLDSFGVPARSAEGERCGQAMTVHAVLFVAASVPLLAVVNLVTLFFGIAVNFLGRDGVRFYLTPLTDRIKAIFIMLPVLLLYAIWHKALTASLVSIFAPAVLTGLAALLLLGAAAGFNRLRSR